MDVQSILWFNRSATFIPYVFIAHKPLIDLFKDKKFIDKYTRTLISSLMVPHLNSVVFRCKTTMWSCLSWTTCSHVCSKTSSCFGAYYRSSFPDNLATSSHRVVLQTLFPNTLSELSCYQPDLNLRQI